MRSFCFWVFTCLCGLTGSNSLAVTADSGFAQQSALMERLLPKPIDLAGYGLPIQQLALDAATLRVMGGVPVGRTLAQVASAPESAFQPFNPAQTYDLNAETALWLHFRVLSEPDTDAARWSFEVPKPFVDRVDFYYRNAQGEWQMLSAGDNIAQLRWPVRGLHPQFYLPNLAPGVNDFYVKVHQLLPLRFSVTLKTIEQATFDNQRTLLANALVCGLLVFVALLALLLAVAYKSAAYAWYAAYVVFAFFAITGYVGIGHYLFWSASVWWSEISHGVCLKAALIAQLQFCRVMFVRPAVTPWLNRVTLAGIAVSVAAILVPLAMPMTAIGLRMGTTLLVLFVTFALMLFIVGKAASQKSTTAWLWVLAYLPMVGFLALTFAEQYAFVSLPWLPYNAVIFAVAFEVLVLMVALHLHAKSKHASNVRKITLTELDPLTGFIAPLYYPDTLARLWSEARHRREDLVLVYVGNDTHARADPDSFVRTGSWAAREPLTSAELMLRQVRMLRSVTRPNDIVANISTQVFAILMPGTSLGVNLISKLSRLKALGLVNDSDDVAAAPVKFQMAVTSFSSFSGTSSQVDNALKDQLLQMTASDGSIAFVKNK